MLSSSPANNERDCLSGDVIAASASTATAATAGLCPRRWDHLLCWPSAEPNLTLAIPCNASRSFVEIVMSSRPTVRTEEIPGLAYLHCNSNSTWVEKTDYEECMTFLNEILSEEEIRRKVRHAVSVITFALCLASVIILLVALAIFSFFKSLKCDRLRVHRNFMLSLVIRYVVSVVYYEPYIYGEDDPSVWYRDSGQGYLCKLMLVLVMYGQVSPVFWMFVEGAYLHSRIVTNVFDTPAPFKFYYFVGWFLPLVCIVTWASMMWTQVGDVTTCSSAATESAVSAGSSACKTNSTCWEGYTEQPLVYIISIPMMLALMINLLILINIVRIVVTKVQHQAAVSASTSSASSSHAESAHVKKAVRATLILFPLLGLTNLLFFINPKNGRHDKIYMLFNASMQSSQGIFLAVLYCFCNSEVQETIKRHLRRITTRNDVRRTATMNSSRYIKDTAGSSALVPHSSHSQGHGQREFGQQARRQYGKRLLAAKDPETGLEELRTMSMDRSREVDSGSDSNRV